MLNAWYWTGISTALFIGIFLFLWLIRWWSQGGQYPDRSVRLNGKIVLITGCNTGIGKETALELARRGAKIYMACRDFKRCEVARKDIIEKTSNKNIINKTLDLASLESIRKFAQEFLKEESRLDILINNAGVLTFPRCLTKDGFEMHIGTNHMGHFLLTNLLLDRLKESAPSRIINVSSLAHKFGKIHRDDLNLEKCYKPHTIDAYCHSKLANILFTRELSKRLHGTGVVANSLHPGLVKTEIHKGLMMAAFYLAREIAGKTSISGAQTTLFLALDPKMGKISGNYYADCKLANEMDAARDDDTADWLWKTSEEWTGLTASK